MASVTLMIPFQFKIFYHLQSPTHRGVQDMAGMEHQLSPASRPQLQHHPSTTLHDLPVQLCIDTSPPLIKETTPTGRKKNSYHI